MEMNINFKSLKDKTVGEVLNIENSLRADCRSTVFKQTCKAGLPRLTPVGA